jgi:hypothetical protein
MRRTIFACGLLLALAGISSAVAAAGGNGSRPAARNAANGPTGAHSIAYWDSKAKRSRANTARWLTIVRGRPPHISRVHESSTPQAAWRQAHSWHERAVAERKVASHPPKRRAWYCIHRYEGSWSDPNAPYWGGLQMDYSFQQAYGPWLLKHRGTANHWTPLAQIWAGVRAWRVRGFEPWSTTAHACGVY